MPLPLVAVLGLVSAAGGVVGRILGAAEEQEALERQQKEIERARRVALLQAGDERVRGSAGAGWQRLRGSHAVSQQQAAAGRSGIDPGTGTAAQLAGYTRMMSEIDAQTELNNAARRAWGLEQQAAAYGREAAAVKKRARNALIGSIIGIGGQAVGALGGVAASMQQPQGLGLSTENIRGGNLEAWAAKWGHAGLSEADFRRKVRGVDRALDWTAGY